MKTLCTALLLLFSVAAQAATPGVYQKSVQQPLDKVYSNVYKSLEAEGFYVVFEPDIGGNLAKMADKWGKDYNQNKLEAIKSMVFCSGWHANRIGNDDPALLALCPLHITLTHKAGTTAVLFVRPGHVAKGSKAAKSAAALEKEVIKAIEAGLHVK